MRSLRELGIGLSVVFVVFFLALIAELCYILYWKNSSTGVMSDKSKSSDCLKLGAGGNAGRTGKRLSGSSPTSFAYEASLVGSFGGYYEPNMPIDDVAAVAHNISAAGTELYRSSTEQGLHLQLFPIKEETKDEMELAADVVVSRLACMMKPDSRLRSRTPSDVLNIHFTSGSSSPAASEDTFTSPPACSAPHHIEADIIGRVEPRSTTPGKLSPYNAACAVQSLQSAPNVLSPPPASTGAMELGLPSTSTSGSGGGRAPLRLLFARSPLVGVLPQSPLIIRSLPREDVQNNNTEACRAAAALSNHRLSLATLFRATPPSYN